ncbi:MAG: VacJ family lipoprotein [Pseudomonadota bacterium]|nr:VacJ family lipoprotein [Pseudomonadota bacterium]
MSLRTGARLALLLVVLAGPVLAQSALPQHIADRLAETVVEARARNAEALRRPVPPANSPGDELVASVAVTSVAERPDLVAEIVRTLGDGVPSARDDIAAAVSGSFPGLAGPVRTAARVAPPPLATTAVAASPTGYWYSQPALACFRTAPAATAPALVQPATAATAQAGDQPDVAGPEAPWDPLLPLNLIFYSFNQAVDLVVVRPVSWLIDQTPDPIQNGFNNAVRNYSEPVTFVNDALQGDFRDAGLSAGRFVLNSTLGLGGLFDVADMWFGWEPHTADFGQTLHSYGVPAGPYLVLPLFGPTTLRDGIGRGVDEVADPFGWFTGTIGRAAHAGSQRISGYERALDEHIAISDAPDHYVAQRDLYYRLRAVELTKSRARLAPAATSRPEVAIETPR